MEDKAVSVFLCDICNNINTFHLIQIYIFTGKPISVSTLPAGTQQIISGSPLGKPVVNIISTQGIYCSWEYVEDFLTDVMMFCFL